MEIPQRIIARVSGPAWEQLRGQFMHIARALLAAGPEAGSDLLTTYVKFTIGVDSHSPVFAALWFKSSKRLIVGLALPEEFEGEGLGPAPPAMTYRGLTKYLAVERGGEIPACFGQWATAAYEHALAAPPAIPRCAELQRAA